MRFPSQEIVEQIRKAYPAGTRVELIEMNDPYNTRLVPGSRGTVRFVDSAGTVHVDWDCGSSLGVVYGEDKVKTIDMEDKAHD